MDKIISIMYFISVLLVISTIYFVKKSDEKLNGYNFIAVSIITAMCYNTLLATLFLIVHIEIGITSFTIVNFIVVIISWIIMFRKKHFQKYEYSKIDIIANIAIIVSILIISSVQFSGHFNVFNYKCLWDSGVHLQFVRDIAQNHNVTTTMYFNAVNMGLILEGVYAFNQYNTGCILFIWTDILIMFLSGSLFWNLIRSKIYDRRMVVLGVFASIAYVLGYPLNNMVFGTSYLGTGNAIVIFSLVLLEAFNNKKISITKFIVFECGTILSLALSYILFVPVAAITVLICFMYYLLNNKILSRKKLYYIIGLIVALALIAIFAFAKFYMVQLYILSWEGQIYRNIFSNFVIFIPLLLLLFTKRNKYKTSQIFLLVVIIYVLIFLFGVLQGKISGYYYFKNYYLLWLACWYGVVTVTEAYKENKTFINAYFIGGILLALVSFSNVKEYLSKYVDSLYGSVFGDTNIDNLFDIYIFNYENAQGRFVDDGTYELFEEAASMNSYINGKVGYVGECAYAMQKQFEAIANQPTIDYLAIYSQEQYVQLIKDEFEYICVIDADYAPFDINDYLSTLEVVYSNERGYIAKVQ